MTTIPILGHALKPKCGECSWITCRNLGHIKNNSNHQTIKYYKVVD